MVRLKGKMRMSKGYENLISIPYGAIKSPDYTVMGNVEIYFNSLWCD